MSSASWQRVQRVLKRAFDVPPSELEAFLQSECRGDSGLRKEVLQLLEADRSAQSDSFLESPPSYPGSPKDQLP